MATGTAHTPLIFPDGVSVVIRSPNETGDPPTPAGTATTITQNDASGRPTLTVFLPEIWYPAPEDQLATDLGNLGLLTHRGPRLQAPGSPLCSLCDRFGAWLGASVHGRRWLPFDSTVRTVVNTPVNLSYVFIMGSLRDVIRTPNCALCSLVTSSLTESAGGDIASVPLRYSTPSGMFDEQIALHCSRFVRGQAGNLQIAFSSSASIILPHTPRNPAESSGHRYDVNISLLADDLARRPTPVIAPTEVVRQIAHGQADISRARDCFNNCRANHGRICEIRRSQALYSTSVDVAILEHGPKIERPDIPNLLLIDIEGMCVTSASPGCGYFALSYVWGSKPFLRLVRENEARLRSEFGLLYEEIPRTIQDAIEVTRFFGVKYIWIDALCIVQNDDDRKREQLLQMDEVFEHATLTIISADGTSVHSGLAGFRPGTRVHTQVIRLIGGLRFAPMSPSLSQQMASRSVHWHERGWTYQEAMLSKRILVFTERQTYYHCNLASCSEDLHFVSGPRERRQGVAEIQNHPLYLASRRHHLSERRDFRLRQHWFSYGPLVEDYSRRQLTYASDVLKALVGILKTMTDPHVERYLCGLPTTFLEWSLQWQPLEPIQRRTYTTSNHHFPSWSWIGWQGRTQMPHYFFHPSSLTPVVDSWVFLTPAPGTNRPGPPSVADDGSFRDYDRDEVHRDFLPYRPDSTPIEQAMPFQPTRWLTGDRVQEALSSNNPHFRDDPNAFSDRIRRHQEDVAAVYPLIESGVLDFMTASAFFSIESTPLGYTYKGFSDQTSSFRIKLGTSWVGTIHLPLKTAEKLFTNRLAEAEFVLISETYSTYEEAPKPNKAEPDIGQYSFDTSLFEHTEKRSRRVVMGNVMWIRRSDGLAYRMGMGQIHLTAWNQADPRKKRILLA